MVENESASVFDADGGESTKNVERKSTENVVLVEDGRMLQKLADALENFRPWSHSILGPIRCHQTGETLHPFFVDQWPSFKVCVAILKPEYFYKFEAPPYVIIHFFALTNDPALIQQTFKNLKLDWRVPIVLMPGANKQQMAAIKLLFEQYGSLKFVDHWAACAQHYATSKKQITNAQLPEDYEYIQLKSDRVAEVAKNWNFFNRPCTLKDVETLMERFRFWGIMHAPTGKLVAQGGQTHAGCAGASWVDPEHRGKKLFQALIARRAADIIERHGFTFGNVAEKNFASRMANNNIGMSSEADHITYCCYLEPFSGATKSNLATVKAAHEPSKF